MAKKEKPSKPITNNSQLATKLTWLPAKTFELEFEIPWEQVKKAFDKALANLASQVTIKGFRKGKAPLEMVRRQLDPKTLYQEALYQLLPQTYSAMITKHNLRPICDPKIIPLKTEEGKSWSFKAVACEAPEVILKDYEDKIKGLKAKDKIWVPGKDKKKPEEKDKEASLREILNLLLSTCQVDLSTILVEEETKRMLGRLLGEVKSLGLTLDEYLKANQKTNQGLQQEYTRTAQETLKLEFILLAIAKDKKISVTDEEIQQLINNVPDPKTKENLQSPGQKAYINAVLLKRKVIDFLTNL
jgi:FKBP-type peptidyl-prolyl cis-trans isomerase (trigger factor)